MDKLPISTFIITLNEADRIGRAISSVIQWVDEVVVVDSGSTDDTVEVAKSLGAQVYFNDWNGYGLQKRFGEDRCKNEWILNLDADEEATEALSKEIEALFFQGFPPKSAYWIHIHDLFPGETKPSRFSYPNNQIRLYNKTVVRFSKRPVHDTVEIPKDTGTLNETLLHYSHRSLAHAVEKLNLYTDEQLADMLETGRAISTWRLYVEFPLTFCKSLFLRKHIFRGVPGFTYSLVYAFRRFLRVAKRIEFDRINNLDTQRRTSQEDRETLNPSVQ